jgi:hypothetical protein
MAQTRRSYSGSGKPPGSIVVIRPFSTWAVIPQRGLAWQLGSQTVLIERESDTIGNFPAIVGYFAYSSGIRFVSADGAPFRPSRFRKHR